jgi:hypothetical protein
MIDMTGASTNTTPGSGGCPDGYYDAGNWLTGRNCKRLPSAADKPAQCDWAKMKWDEYLACSLGITPSSAALVGLGLGAVGVFALIALAKR